jgi:hypothetical protein
MLTHRRRTAIALFGPLLCCSSPEPGPTKNASGHLAAAEETGTVTPAETIDLVSPSSWQRLDADLDPYPEHRPEGASCPETSWFEEDGLLEIETSDCDYINLTQPSAAEIREGDRLELLVFHSSLSSVDEPAEAHIAVLLDGGVLMDEIIPIPSTSKIYDQTLVADVDVAKGGPIVLHLHNHGGNAWKLGHLRRVRD